MSELTYGPPLVQPVRYYAVDSLAQGHNTGPLPAMSLELAVLRSPIKHSTN